jgi:ATP adenylyltransferase
MMKHIWAPWRMKYIQKQNKGCVFCDVQRQPDGPNSLIVYRDEKAFVILNRYPYTSGHIMVVANVHLPSLEDLDPGTRADMIELATKGMRILREVYQPQAFNLGANIGEAAGAGVAGHVHIHIVPRWGGDTNFMGAIAETRVLPEGLEDTYARIHNAWVNIRSID